MRQARRIRFRVMILTAVFAATGCAAPADSLPRETISGTVKLDGKPLISGLIQFQPTSPGEATAGGAGITDGKYAITRAEGLVPGKYQVIITSVAASTATPGAMPGDSPPPTKELIPTKYNTKTNLSAAVTKEGPNTFDFNLDPK